MGEDEAVEQFSAAGAYDRCHVVAMLRGHYRLPTAANWNGSFPVAGKPLGRGRADVDVLERAGDCSSVGAVFCSARTFEFVAAEEEVVLVVASVISVVPS